MPEKYNNISGWSDEGMFAVYRHLIDTLPDNAILIEAGCWKGRSSTYLLEYRQEKNREDIDIYFVDRFTGDEYGIRGNDGDDVKTFFDNLKNAGFHTKEDYFIHIGDSIHFAATKLSRIRLEYPDLFIAVYLDDNHQENYVRQEILEYKKYCDIISGHDYLDPTIRRVVKEVLGQVQDFGSSYLYQPPITLSTQV